MRQVARPTARTASLPRRGYIGIGVVWRGGSAARRRSVACLSRRRVATDAGAAPRRATQQRARHNVTGALPSREPGRGPGAPGARDRRGADLRPGAPRPDEPPTAAAGRQAEATCARTGGKHQGERTAPSEPRGKAHTFVLCRRLPTGTKAASAARGQGLSLPRAVLPFNPRPFVVPGGAVLHLVGWVLVVLQLRRTDTALPPVDRQWPSVVLLIVKGRVRSVLGVARRV